MKILIAGDMHTGSLAGLNPPAYQSGPRDKVRKQMKKWVWWLELIEHHGPFDMHINTGDVIDGLGVKDGTECIIPDPNRQIEAAIECIKAIKAPENLFVAGTRAHTITRDGLEMDKMVANEFKTARTPKNFKGQLFIHIDVPGHKGWELNVRHAPGSRSGVKSTRAMPIGKERDANVEWHRRGQEPLGDLYFRGHLHYSYNAGVPGRWQGYILPSIQSPDTKYGRILSRGTDTGAGYLTITKDGDWPIWTPIPYQEEMVEVLQYTIPAT